MNWTDIVKSATTPIEAIDLFEFSTRCFGTLLTYTLGQADLEGLDFPEQLVERNNIIQLAIDLIKSALDPDFRQAIVKFDCPQSVFTRSIRLSTHARQQFLNQYWKDDDCDFETAMHRWAVELLNAILLYLEQSAVYKCIMIGDGIRMLDEEYQCHTCDNIELECGEALGANCCNACRPKLVTKIQKVFRGHNTRWKDARCVWIHSLK
jgi:hypothetical protein